MVNFDLKADLTSLFNWNTKLLFVSVLCEWTNKDFVENQVVVWDDIIRSKDAALLSYKNKKWEYPIHDISDKLPGSTANLTLQYQIVPWVGFFLQDRKVFENAIVFPAK